MTTFTVESPDDGRRSRAAIPTVWTSRGLRAIMELLLAPLMLRRIYAEELQKLARVADGRTSTGAPA